MGGYSCLNLSVLVTLASVPSNARFVNSQGRKFGNQDIKIQLDLRVDIRAYECYNMFIQLNQIFVFNELDLELHSCSYSCQLDSDELDWESYDAYRNTASYETLAYRHYAQYNTHRIIYTHVCATIISVTRYVPEWELAQSEDPDPFVEVDYSMDR